MRFASHILGVVVSGLFLTAPAWADSDSDPTLAIEALFDLPDEYAILTVPPPHAPADLPASIRLEVLPTDDSYPTSSIFSSAAGGSDRSLRRRYKKRDLFRAEKRLGVRGDRDLRLRFRIKAKQRELMTVELKF